MNQSTIYPPPRLARRVGGLPEGRNNLDGYLEMGRATRAAIEALLPAEWTWENKRVLDFGCGAGRTLRHFLPEAEQGTFYGCDIHQPSLDWLTEHFVPPFHVLHNEEHPPVGLPSESLDLIYAVSVFTHITVEWSAWMVELHRMLAPNGLLIATFMGEGMCERVSGQTWDEDRIGMTVFAPHQDWDAGGPMVLHSPWWIQEHWGRLFEIDAIHPSGFSRGASIFGVHDHGVAVLRKGDKTSTASDLELPNTNDPREVMALSYQVDRLLRWPSGRAGSHVSGRQAANALADSLRSSAVVHAVRRGSLVDSVERRLRWKLGK